MSRYNIRTIFSQINFNFKFTKFYLFFFEMQAKKAKQAEIERKRAEVRKRMEEASKAKKAKKGFMTPERKKKLRVCLLKCCFINYFNDTLFLIIVVVA